MTTFIKKLTLGYEIFENQQNIFVLITIEYVSII